ncbi:hypothetical protein N7486_002635 [Penicillium sp. IBT 16267x]|nr:hypothetical protein N7486_002635 [Penicillium sp. IBT 16267x]
MTGNGEKQSIQETVENSREIIEEVLKTAIAARKLEELKTRLRYQREVVAALRRIDELEEEITQRENTRMAREQGRLEATKMYKWLSELQLPSHNS